MNKILDKLTTGDGAELTLVEIPFDYEDCSDPAPYTLYQALEGHETVAVGRQESNLDMYREDDDLLKCQICGALVANYTYSLEDHLSTHIEDYVGEAYQTGEDVDQFTLDHFDSI